MNRERFDMLAASHPEVAQHMLLSLDIEPVTGLARFDWSKMIHDKMPSRFV